MKWMKKRRVVVEPKKPFEDHPFHALEDPIKADYRGIPTHECPCGSNWILVCTVFDPETKLPGLYMLDGMCASCGALLTIDIPPTEDDYL